MCGLTAIFMKGTQQLKIRVHISEPVKANYKTKMMPKLIQIIAAFSLSFGGYIFGIRRKPKKTPEWSLSSTHRDMFMTQPELLHPRCLGLGLDICF